MDALLHRLPAALRQSGPGTLLCIALGAYLILSTIRTRVARRSLPPGPPGWPLVGNLFQLSFDIWVPLTKWKEQYGNILYLNVAGQHVVVLNSQKVAADLLDRRAAKYSDRPPFIVASEMLTGGFLVVFSHYNDTWRRMRRASHEGLNKHASANFQPYQSHEAVLLVDGIIKHPEAWDDHLRRAAASMINSVVYDNPPVESEQDPTIAHANDFVARLTNAAIPGAHLVEYFTWMQYLPESIAKWKRDAMNQYRKDSVKFEGMYKEVRRRVNEGDQRASLCATLVKEQQKYGLDDTQTSWLAATMYAAGSETTSGTLAWFTLAMVLYPEVQKRAQEELDAVVGRSRLPTFADFDQLHYIRATVKEALRWRMVDPIAVPHRSVEDDWYEGYFIPKGTVIIANVWALNRDPEIYGEDAHHFNPARHLDADGKLKPAPPDTKEESHFTYGFGRRICVGRHVANNSLFIDIASILWAVTISHAKDADGNIIMPQVDGCVNNGLSVRPVPFECSIVPRFPEAPQLVANAKELLGARA